MGKINDYITSNHETIINTTNVLRDELNTFTYAIVSVDGSIDHEYIKDRVIDMDELSDVYGDEFNEAVSQLSVIYELPQDCYRNIELLRDNSDRLVRSCDVVSSGEQLDEDTEWLLGNSLSIMRISANGLIYLDDPARVATTESVIIDALDDLATLKQSIKANDIADSDVAAAAVKVIDETWGWLNDTLWNGYVINFNKVLHELTVTAHTFVKLINNIRE